MKHSHDKKSGTSLQEMSRNTASYLTSATGIDRNLCMDGQIRTKEKCPKCKGKFKGEFPGGPLHCPVCLITPTKYFLDLYVKGHGRIRIYSDRHGHPLDSYRRALRVIETIRYAIDQHIFDPSRFVSADLKSFLFENLIEAWYKRKEKAVAKGHLAGSYTRCLKHYKDAFFLSFFKGMDVREIRTYHIQEFYDNLPTERKVQGKKKKYTLKYYKNIINALENFFNTLHLLDKIEKKPVFPKITLDRKAPRWIDRGTQLKAIAALPERDRPIFTFLAFQGIRPGEARALKVKDINFEDASFIVSRTYSDRVIRERVKGKVMRPRAINPLLEPLLKEQCSGKHPEAFVFVNPRTGRPYTQNLINALWMKVRESMGLDLPLYNATRHSLASNLLKDGANLKSIGDILGHTDIRTTLKYAHSGLANQRIAFANQGEVVGLSQQKALKKQSDE